MQNSYVLGPRATRRVAFRLPESFRDGLADNPTNPSTVVLNGRTIAAVRCVSYTYHPETNLYSHAHPRGVCCTRTFILDGGCVASVVPYDVPGWPYSERVPDPDRLVETSRGIEDIRLFVRDGQLYGIGTCSVDPNRWSVPTMVMLTFDEELQIESVESLRWEESYPYGSGEKNWLPWETEAGLVYIYSWDPFILLGGPLSDLKMFVNRPGLEQGWRGSASPIVWGNDTALALVHRVSGDPKEYEHAFVLIHPDGALTLSMPFVFDCRGIEFGMSLVPTEGGLCVSYGFQDVEARWAWFDRDTIDELFSGKHPT